MAGAFGRLGVPSLEQLIGHASVCILRGGDR
jgi:hypothetical protein